MLDATVAFGQLSFKGFNARVLDDSLDATSALNTLVEAVAEPVEIGVAYRHRFNTWRGSYDVVIHLFADQGRALRAVFRLENAPEPRPWSVVYLEDLSVGAWSGNPERIYAGVGNVLVNPEAFDLYFDGHQLASSFVGFDFKNSTSLVQATDVPPSRLHFDPAQNVCTLHTALNQTMTFIAGKSVWDAAKVWRDISGLKAAPGVSKLAGRFVFDLWGGKYGPSTEALRQSFDYGMTNSAVVWHNWQRWGYDYRLPDIWPPNPQFGTVEEFQALAAACKDRGVLFAPHDNYIDLYPDSSRYTFDNIAFTPHGQPIRGWLNEGRGAQAYRWRTGAYRPALEENVRLIKENTAANSFFIDVWSSAGPYESWTRDGALIDRIATRNDWADCFNWIRQTLGDNAPQISESGHDQLIGSLDGAQTNHLRVDANPPQDAPFVWRIKCADSERIPWLDFAYHDRFALHGAGYESRYLGGLDKAVHGIFSGDYICTEVLTGHPAMTPVPFSRDGVRKYWLLDGLMRALAGRQMTNFEFDGSNIHRQHVTWDNGVEVWVNRGKEDWTVAGGHVLPQYGFYARSNDVEAAIERYEDVIIEYSRERERWYVNARQVAVEGRGNPNRKMVHFGTAITNGAFKVEMKDGVPTRTPLPEEPPFEG